MKKKDKVKEIEKDMFAVSKMNKAVMVIFLIVMTLLWMLPIYSLLKDSLKVNGLENYS